MRTRSARISFLLVLALVVGLLATGPVATAHHWDGYSPIIPFGSQHHGGETIQAAVDETLEFGTRWGACTRGLAQAYARNAEVVVWVDGVELEPVGWSRPVNPDYSISSASFEDLCTSNAYRDTGWWVFWKAPFTFTEPGLYTVTVEVTHTDDIHDGAGSFVEEGDTFWGEVSIQVGYPLIFPAWTTGEDVATAGQVLADALHEETGVDFFVVEADGPGEMYDMMCSMPGTAVGIVFTHIYASADDDCEMDASFKAIRFGHDLLWTQFLVPRDSTLDEIADLDGLTWAYSDTGSLSSYWVPLGMMEMAGVTPDGSAVGSHHGAVTAVYDDATDTVFGTTYFSPPWVPVGEWQPGDPPDIPDSVVPTCGWEGTGLYCGPDDEWRVLDARASNALVGVPDIVQRVRILDISPPIPNDAVAFGAQFPDELRHQVETAMSEFADPDGPQYEDVWQASLGLLYLWGGITPAVDADWDWLRDVLEAAGFDIDDL